MTDRCKTCTIENPVPSTCWDCEAVVLNERINKLVHYRDGTYEMIKLAPKTREQLEDREHEHQQCAGRKSAESKEKKD